jgi:hypothetical protein
LRRSTSPTAAACTSRRSIACSPSARAGAARRPKPIGGLAALDLADGSRVHFETLDCLLAFGTRWRGEATAGLRALGLDPPPAEDEAGEAP